MAEQKILGSHVNDVFDKFSSQQIPKAEVEIGDVRESKNKIESMVVEMCVNVKEDQIVDDQIVSQNRKDKFQIDFESQDGGEKPKSANLIVLDVNKGEENLKTNKFETEMSLNAEEKKEDKVSSKKHSTGGKVQTSSYFSETESSSDDPKEEMDIKKILDSGIVDMYLERAKKPRKTIDEKFSKFKQKLDSSRQKEEV